MLSRARRLAALFALCALTPGCGTPPTEGSRPAPFGWTFDEGAVIRGDRAARTLALVFTGGEFGEGTGHVLEVLRHTDIPGSFFVTGDFLAVADQRAGVAKMVADGHYVGPHSDAHPLYCAWEDRSSSLIDESFFRDDLARNIADLRSLGALTADQPVFFIPPYEWFNRDQVEWAARMGVALFNFTPGSGSNRDWIPEGDPGFVSSEAILDRVLEFERTEPDGLNGFLLLLHLGSERRDKMHLQLGPLLEELAARGYSFVRVDELLAGADQKSSGPSTTSSASPNAVVSVVPR